MATFGYGRVSTGTQTTHNQRLELEQAGYVIEPDFWFADEGISGKVAASQRPAFKAMLGQIRKGETLVVSKLDRLGRDAIDVLQTVRQLADRGVKVVVLQLGDTDLTAPAGKLLLSMLAAVAEMPAAAASESDVERSREVVAEEVRALAQRSASASHEIKQLIEATVSKVEAGSAVVSEVVGAMETINTTTLDLSQAMEEIAAASSEQAAGVDELNRAITQVDSATQSNAAIVEELAGSATVMHGSAIAMLDLVSTFRTKA